MENTGQIGQFIKQERLKCGFKTQKQLSAVSGISQTTLSRIEAGNQRPGPDTLAIIANFLKSTTYAELMTKAGYFSGMRPEEQDVISEFFTENRFLDENIDNTLNDLLKNNNGDRYFPSDVARDLKNETMSIISKYTSGFSDELITEFKNDPTPGGFKIMLDDIGPNFDMKVDLLDMLNLIKRKYSYFYKKEEQEKPKDLLLLLDEKEVSLHGEVLSSEYLKIIKASIEQGYDLAKRLSKHKK